MSKKRKLEQVAAKQKHDDFIVSLNEAAQKNIKGEELEEKKGLLDVVRRAKPKIGEPDTEPEKTEDEPLPQVELIEPEPEPTPEPEPEPIEVAPEATSGEEPPQWAKDLVESQKAFQGNVDVILTKTSRVLTHQSDKIEDLEGRIKNLEFWKQTVMEMEKAKTEVETESEAEAETEVEPEDEPETEVESETEAETTEEDDEKIALERVADVIRSVRGTVLDQSQEQPETDLKPGKGWKARIIENGEVRYSKPYLNINVAARFATFENDVEQVFGWINQDKEFVREMTLEELEKYGGRF